MRSASQRILDEELFVPVTPLINSMTILGNLSLLQMRSNNYETAENETSRY